MNSNPEADSLMEFHESVQVRQIGHMAEVAGGEVDFLGALDGEEFFAIEGSRMHD